MSSLDGDLAAAAAALENAPADVLALLPTINFSADFDANKNYSLGYANNYNGIDYGAKYDNDGNLMFNEGVTFKNGGLAGLI